MQAPEMWTIKRQRGEGNWEWGREGEKGKKETGLSFPISAIVPAFVVLVMWRVQKLKL